MSDESAKLIARVRADCDARDIGRDYFDEQVTADNRALAALAETALADLALMTAGRDVFQRRAEAAESALARMKAQGTFAEGVEAAASRIKNDYLSYTWTEMLLRDIRALVPPKPAEEPQS